MLFDLFMVISIIQEQCFIFVQSKTLFRYPFTRTSGVS